MEKKNLGVFGDLTPARNKSLPIKARGQSSSPVKGRRLKLNPEYGMADVCLNSDDPFEDDFYGVEEDNELLEADEPDGGYPQYNDDNEEEMMPDFMDDEEDDDLLDDSGDEKGDFARMQQLGGKTEPK